MSLAENGRSNRASRQKEGGHSANAVPTVPISLEGAVVLAQQVALYGDRALVRRLTMGHDGVVGRPRGDRKAVIPEAGSKQPGFGMTSKWFLAAKYSPCCFGFDIRFKDLQQAPKRR